MSFFKFKHRAILWSILLMPTACIPQPEEKGTAIPLSLPAEDKNPTAVSDSIRRRLRMLLPSSQESPTDSASVPQQRIRIEIQNEDGKTKRQINIYDYYQDNLEDYLSDPEDEITFDPEIFDFLDD